MRLFIAVKIEAEATLLTILDALQQELKQVRIKWVEKHNLHVTLWFFGEKDEQELPFIRNEMLKAAAGIPPFSIQVKDCGIFGKARNPSVIWLGLQVPAPMVVLHERIRDAFNHKTDGQEAVNFTPHLTIGRIKQAVHAAKLKPVLQIFRDMVFQESPVNAYTLYRSHLTPAGPRYEALFRVDFLKEPSQTQEPA